MQDRIISFPDFLARQNGHFVFPALDKAPHRADIKSLKLPKERYQLRNPSFHRGRFDHKGGHGVNNKRGRLALLRALCSRCGVNYRRRGGR
jgi:hypothetical protein